MNLLTERSYGEFVRFNPAITRGFDYYTGLVFEMYDKSPKNNRAMFGGGRYDDLLDIFGKQKMPAVGFAPGDITFQLFLEEWGLLPEFDESPSQVLVTLFPVESEDLRKSEFELSQELRKAGISVEMVIEEESLAKQLTLANKRKIPFVCVIGPDELKKNIVRIKNMETSEEALIEFEKVVVFLAGE